MKMGKIFSANLKMIYRDKISLFWALVFPLLFIALFGLFSQGMSSEHPGQAGLRRPGGRLPRPPSSAS